MATVYYSSSKQQQIVSPFCQTLEKIMRQRHNWCSPLTLNCLSAPIIRIITCETFEKDSIGLFSTFLFEFRLISNGDKYFSSNHNAAEFFSLADTSPDGSSFIVSEVQPHGDPSQINQIGTTHLFMIIFNSCAI